MAPSTSTRCTPAAPLTSASSSGSRRNVSQTPSTKLSMYGCRSGWMTMSIDADRPAATRPGADRIPWRSRNVRKTSGPVVADA